jgi:5'/3'-nucleotidase
MHILVSNDDGIYSPGIQALAEVAAELGSVRIVAPDVERSSMGHAITSSQPLSYRPTKLQNFEAFRVNGTPADCIALGAYHWDQVDLVLSGFNLGLNLGNAIWHSGTLAASKQAVLLGIRGVALSAPSGVEEFEPLKAWARLVLDALVSEPDLWLVNVNFPRDPRGLLWTRASVRQYDGRVVPTQDPMGRELYWFTVKPLEAAEEGTDRWAIEQGWISMTPLRLDLTDEEQLQRVHLHHPLDEVRAAALSDQRSSAEAAKTVRQDEAAPPLDETATIAKTSGT